MHPEFLDHLPEKWKLLPLSEACTFTSKPRSLNTANYSEVAFVPMELIPSDRLKSSNFTLKPSASISSGTYFEDGDLLLSKITPCFENGKQAIAHSIPNGFGFASTEVIPIKGRDGLTFLPFIAYYLLHYEVRALLAASMEGATGRQRLPKDVLADLPIPIPPLDEQRVIAAVLESIQAASQLEITISERLAALKSATMAKVFREGLRGEILKRTEIGEFPESWEVLRLGDLARIGNGSTPKRTTEAYWKDGHIPWITSTKIHNVIITRADEFVTEDAFRECHLPMVPRKSLVVAITGQGKTLGNVALLDIDTCINQHLAFLQFQVPSVSPEFYLFFLQSLYSYFRQISASGGSTKGALTCGFIANLKVPTPPSDQQREIADLLLLLTRRHMIATKRSEALFSLFRAVLPQLTTGEIGLQGLDLSEVSHA